MYLGYTKLISFKGMGKLKFLGLAHMERLLGTLGVLQVCKIIIITIIIINNNN